MGAVGGSIAVAGVHGCREGSFQSSGSLVAVDAFQVKWIVRSGLGRFAPALRCCQSGSLALRHS